MGPLESRMSFLGHGMIQSTLPGLSWALPGMKRALSGLTWDLVPALGPFSPKLRTRREMDYFTGLACIGPPMLALLLGLSALANEPVTYLRWRGGDVVTCSPLNERKAP